jgi:hypothetical protein
MISCTLVLAFAGSGMCLQMPILSSPRALPQAFTWNGFEDGTTFLGGLWAGKTTQQGDFATLVYRAQLYGFNAVRLPFRWECLCWPGHRSGNMHIAQRHGSDKTEKGGAWHCCRAALLVLLANEQEWG